MAEAPPDGLHTEPGWQGAFTRQEALGAWPNGTRVVKSRGAPGDAHPVGTPGTVLGSRYHRELGYAYFVEWDRLPRCAVLVVAWKLTRLEAR